jgi:RNA polymerase sigma factor (sigma-70 family)
MSNAIILYAHLTDKELVDKVKAGQKVCFEVLIRRHGQALYRIGRMYGFSHSEVEELVHCTFLEAFSRLGQFRGSMSYRTWLTKLMINSCMSSLREKRGQGIEVTEPACSAARSEQHYTSTRLALTLEGAAKLEACIEQLPVPLRAVYILSEIDGYSLPETAHLLTTTEETVKVKLEEAKASLRQSLKRWYKYSDIYPFDRHSFERLAHGIMKGIDERSDVPVGAPTF